MVKGRKQRTSLDAASRCITGAFLCWIIGLAALVAILAAVALSACHHGSGFLEGLSVCAWIAVVPCLMLHWLFLREARADVARAAGFLRYPGPPLREEAGWARAVELLAAVLALAFVVMGALRVSRVVDLDPGGRIAAIAVVICLLVLGLLVPPLRLADHHELVKRVAAFRDQCVGEATDLEEG